MFRFNRCMDMGTMRPPVFDMQAQQQATNNLGDPTMMGMGSSIPGTVSPPVYEMPVERCFQRQIVHEVPHLCPVNTRIINNHICRHTFSPCYTCCEENVVSHVYEGSCCGF